MSPIKCFIIVPTRTSQYRLRRYAGSDLHKCPGYGYHNAQGPEIASTADDPASPYHCTNPPAEPDHADPRWPVKCDHCEYRFDASDRYQVFGEPLYTRPDTGEVFGLRDAPAGALYRAPWLEEDSWIVGFDGQSWICVTPGGWPWQIDGEANNCNRKGDKTHRCWYREGVAPNFTIIHPHPKSCTCGAGSILTSKWHGFLRNGYLITC